MSLLVRPSFAQSVAWDLASDYPATSLPGLGDKMFADLLSEKSNGDMSINLHLGGSLGLNSSQMLDAVGSGALPIGDASSNFYNGADPLFGMAGLPFLAATPAEMQKLFGIAQPYYEDSLERFGHQLLYVTPWTAVGIWARKPIPTIEELTGLKMRTADAYASRVFGAAGANPVQLSWSDTVPQVTTGGIDAVLTSDEAGLGASLFEQLRYFVELRYNNSFNMVSMNRDIFDGLSDERRNILLSVAAETQEWIWTAIAERAVKNHEKLRERGVELVTPDQALLDKLREAAEPVIADWKAQVGQRGDEILAKYQGA